MYEFIIKTKRAGLTYAYIHRISGTDNGRRMADGLHTYIQNGMYYIHGTQQTTLGMYYTEYGTQYTIITASAAHGTRHITKNASTTQLLPENRRIRHIKGNTQR